MKNAVSIAKKLATIGKSVYVVGSYNVHAILRKNFWSDIDLATPARPEDVKQVLKVVGEIWSKYGTLIVREWGGSYEITTFRKDIWSVNRRRPEEVIFTDSLEEDASRRDFTFNAIYFDPLREEYTDPTGGIADLDKGLIRFIGDANERINEDALRILRFIRLKHAYGLTNAEEHYDELLAERMSDLKEISKERIKQELDKVLLLKHNVEALEDLKRLGFFKHIIPQIDNLSHAPGGRKMHLEWDVWIHTKMAIGELNHMKCRDVDTYWATLLHDIGKYSTYSFDDYGNVHYYRHEDEGVKIFKEFVTEILPFTKQSIKKIAWLIENHIRVGAIEEMKKPKRYRFMMHPNFPELIDLYTADNRGKVPGDTECGPKLQQMYEDFQRKMKSVVFVTGDDVMEKYPQLRGTEIGRKLKEENDAILNAL